MKKYTEQQKIAIKMRTEGFSLPEICEELSLGKGTIHPWIKHIPYKRKYHMFKDLTKHRKPRVLSEDKINKIVEMRLENKTLSFIANKLLLSTTTVCRVLIDKNLSFKLNGDKSNNWSHRQKVIRTEKYNLEAEEQFSQFINDPLFMLGLGLYWGEGGKTSKSLDLCNSDYGLINSWIMWCEKYIPNIGLKYSLYIHDTSDLQHAINFWKNQCEIDNPRIIFLKRQSKKLLDKVSHKMPCGVMRVMASVGGTKEHTKMMCWLELMRTTYSNKLVSLS